MPLRSVRPEPPEAEAPSVVSIDAVGLRAFERGQDGLIRVADSATFGQYTSGNVLVLDDSTGGRMVVGWGLVDAIVQAVEDRRRSRRWWRRLWRRVWGR